MPPPYPPQPGYAPQPGYPPPRQGMGCFAKGCLTLVIILALLGVLVGGAAWYVYHNIAVFVSTTPLKIRTYPATDEQYQDVRKRYDAFIAAINRGEAATLSISADDLNVLIAKDPQYKDLRGEMYVSIVNNEMIAELCVPNKSSSGTTTYFGGKAYGTVSYANDELSVVVNKIETMDGSAAPGLVQMFIKQTGTSGFTQSINENLRDNRRKDPSLDEALKKLRTVKIENNHIVATAVAGQPSEHPLGRPAAPVDTTPAGEPTTPAGEPTAPPADSAGTPAASATPETTP